MKYSVIIPCYDAPEEYFRRCLDSIKGQTLKPFEVICVDDCSPVETPKICEEYGFKYVRNEENLNNGGARNRGVKEASGEYLVFVNSDDYLVPEALEEIDRVNEGQDLILIGFHAFGSYEYEGIPNEENTPFISKMDWNGEPLHVCRRDFFINNELWEREHCVYADVDWAPRVEEACNSYGYVSKALYQFETGMPFTLTQKLFRGETSDKTY